MSTEPVAEPEVWTPEASPHIAAKPEKQIYFDSDGHQADDEDLSEAKDLEPGRGQESQLWEVMYIQGEFEIAPKEKYTSLQEIEQAIQKQKKKLEELSQKGPLSG